MQAIRADYFGRTAYGAILGVSSLIITFGTISGPVVAGYLADQTGNYVFGFTVLALFSGLGSIFFLLAKRPALPATDRYVAIARSKVRIFDRNAVSLETALSPASRNMAPRSHAAYSA